MSLRCSEEFWWGMFEACHQCFGITSRHIVGLNPRQELMWVGYIVRPGKDSRAFSDLQWLGVRHCRVRPTRGVNAEGPTRPFFFSTTATDSCCIFHGGHRFLVFGQAFFHLLYFKVQNSRTAVKLLKKFGGTEYGCAWFEGSKIGDSLVQPANRR